MRRLPYLTQWRTTSMLASKSSSNTRSGWVTYCAGLAIATSGTTASHFLTWYSTHSLLMVMSPSTKWKRGVLGRSFSLLSARSMPYTSQGRVRRIALVSALPMKPLAPRIMIFSAIAVLTRPLFGGRSLPRRTRGSPLLQSFRRLRREGQSDVVLGQRLGAGARGDDVVELGKLAAPIERRVVFEAMQERGHPPGEALCLPDPAQTGLRVGVQALHGRRSARVHPRSVEGLERACKHVHVGYGQVHALGPRGGNDV